MQNSVYEQNIRLINCCEEIVRFAREQSFYSLMKKLNELIKGMEEYEEDLKHIYEDAYMINDIVNALIEIKCAQEAEDYILIADIIELKLLSVIKNIQIELICNGFGREFDEIYEYNIVKLRKKNKNLADKIDSIKDRWIKNGSEKFELEQTNCGLYTLAIKNGEKKRYMHSNNNPRQEAVALVDRYYNPSAQNYIVYGLGLGYICEEINQRDRLAEIQIYENNPEVIFFAMISNRHNWLDCENVELHYDEDLKNFIKKVEGINDVSDYSKGVLIIHYPSISNIQNSSVRYAMEKVFIRGNGIREQIDSMRAAFRENIKSCTRNVGELKSIFCGKKAVVVSGGPSLDKNIKSLKKKGEGTLIIAVGTVLKKLLSHGIKVDYVVVEDTRIETGNQFDGLLDCEVPVLILSTAYMEIARKYKGEKYLICQEGFREAREYAHKNGYILMKTGGSVSSLALEICISLGCKEVALAGLDLAYPDNRTHASGTALGTKIQTNGMKMINCYSICDDKVIHCELPTSHLFEMYRNFIEDLVKNANIPVFDATEGGAVIAGTKIITLEKYMTS